MTTTTQDPIAVENARLRDALQGLIDWVEIDKLPMDEMAMSIAREALQRKPAPSLPSTTLPFSDKGVQDTPLHTHLVSRMPMVYVVEMTEYERGWGQRPDGYVTFLTEEAATSFVAEKTNGYVGFAPDIYVSYKMIGFRKCSQAFMADMAGDMSKCADHLRGLTA